MESGAHCGDCSCSSLQSSQARWALGCLPFDDVLWFGEVLSEMPNNTFDLTAGSHSLATAGQRERSPHWRRDLACRGRQRPKSLLLSTEDVID
jgi:hypothetical protein